MYMEMGASLGISLPPPTHSQSPVSSVTKRAAACTAIFSDRKMRRFLVFC